MIFVNNVYQLRRSNVGVNFGGGNAGMAKHLLNRTEICFMV